MHAQQKWLRKAEGAGVEDASSVRPGAVAASQGKSLDGSTHNRTSRIANLNVSAHTQSCANTLPASTPSAVQAVLQWLRSAENPSVSPDAPGGRTPSAVHAAQKWLRNAEEAGVEVASDLSASGQPITKSDQKLL